MKRILMLCLLIGSFSPLFSQQYFTRTGEISFYSSTPVEDIEAHNKTVTAIFDSKTGKIQFSVAMKSFKFEKALMEEHFNENYVESDQFPKATFSGLIQNIAEVNCKKDGIYDIRVSGDLTIHGVTQKVDATGSLTVKGENIIGKSVIVIKPEDYKIEIPGVVRDKIAKEVKVDINLNLQEKK